MIEKMPKKKKLPGITLWLLIIGGLNWGLTALGINLVKILANAITLNWLAIVVYIVVAISAIYQIILKIK